MLHTASGRAIRRATIVATGIERSSCSAHAVAQALQDLGVDVGVCDTQVTSLEASLREFPADALFPTGLTGRLAQGVPVGLLDAARSGIPFVGSGVRATAAALNRLACLNTFRALGFFVPDSVCLLPQEQGQSHIYRGLNPDDQDMLSLAGLPRFDHLAERLGLPLVIRPMYADGMWSLGSAYDESSFWEIFARAAPSAGPLLIEESVVSHEPSITYAVAILEGSRAGGGVPPLLALGQVRTALEAPVETRTWERYQFPAPLDRQSTRYLRAAAWRIYQHLACKGYARVDLLVSERGIIYPLGVTPHPGMIPDAHFFPQACTREGLEYHQVIARLVESASCQQRLAPPAQTLTRVPQSASTQASRRLTREGAIESRTASPLSAPLPSPGNHREGAANAVAGSAWRPLPRRSPPTPDKPRPVFRADQSPFSRVLSLTQSQGGERPDVSSTRRPARRDLAKQVSKAVAAPTGEPAAHPSLFLANPPYRWLVSGQVITNSAFALYFVLLFVWVYALTGSAAAVTGVLVVINGSACLTGPLAGVFIDRWNRKRILVVVTVLLSAFTLPPIFVSDLARLPAIYVSAFLLSACTSFFMPAKSGVLQAIVSEEHLTQASYWSAAGLTTGYVVGGAAAAQLYYSLGPMLALGGISALFLSATLCLLCIRLPQEVNQQRRSVAPETFVRSIGAVGGELLDGLRFILRTRSLRWLLLCVCLVIAATNCFNAVNIAFVTQRLDVSAELFGPVNVSIGIGTLLGAVLAGILVKKTAAKYLFGGGILLLGMGLIIYSLLDWYPAALVLIGVAVIPQSGVDTGMGPILINSSPPTIIGRVQSAVESFSLGSAVFATLLVVFIVQILSVEFIILAAGLLVFLAGVLALFGLERQPGIASSGRGVTSPMPSRHGLVSGEARKGRQGDRDVQNGQGVIVVTPSGEYDWSRTD